MSRGDDKSIGCQWVPRYFAESILQDVNKQWEHLIFHK